MAVKLNNKPILAVGVHRDTKKSFAWSTTEKFVLLAKWCGEP